MQLAARTGRLGLSLAALTGLAMLPACLESARSPKPAPTSASPAVDWGAERTRLQEQVASAGRSGDLHAQAVTLIRLAEVESAIGLGRAAGEALERASSLAAHLADDAERIALAATASAVEFENGRYESSERHARAWLDLALAGHVRAQEARARMMLARILVGDASEEQRKLALELLSSLDDRHARIDVLQGDALILRERGAATEALAQVAEALQLAGDGHALVELLGLEGNLHLDLLEDDAAREAYERSAARARAEGRSGFEAKYLHAEALVDRQQGALEVALAKLLRARDLLRQDGSAADLAELELTLAGVYQDLAVSLDPADPSAAADRAKYVAAQREICERIAQSGAAAGPAGSSAAARALYSLAIACEYDDREQAERLLGRAEEIAAAGGLARESALVLGAQAWLRYLEARAATDPAEVERGLDASAALGQRAAERFAALGDTDNRFAVLDTCVRALLQLERLDEVFAILRLASDELGVDVATRDAARRSSLPYPALAYFEGHWQDWMGRALARDLSESDKQRIRAEAFENTSLWRGRQLFARILRPRTELAHAAESLLRDRSVAARSGARAGAASRGVDAQFASELAIRALTEREVRPLRTLAGVQSALPDSSTVVLQYAAGVRDEVDLDARRSLFAYVLTKGGLFTVDVGDWNRIQSDALRFTAGLDGALRELDPSSKTDFDPIDVLATRGRALRACLVDAPLAALPAEVRREVRSLVIVPTGALATLPFEALVADAPGPPPLKYLVQDFECTYAPSTAVYAALRRAEAPADSGDALILVDPRYEAPRDPAAGSERAGAPDRLPHSLEEGCKLGLRVLGLAETRLRREGRLQSASLDRVRDTTIELAHMGDSTKPQEDRYLEAPGLRFRCGAKASPSALLEGDLGRYSLIHIGAHARPDLAQPQESRILLAPDPDGRDIVRRADIVQLQLHARLVTLSGCQSALGPDAYGEGMLSLAHSFLLAGSSSVLASLWALRDDKASEFALGFYRSYFEPGAGPAAAARAAKLQMIKEALPRGEPVYTSAGTQRLTSSADPYYWATFVVVGLP